MKNLLLIILFVVLKFISYSQILENMDYHLLTLNYKLHYFVRNDTVFGCNIYTDNREDSIKYYPIMNLKSNCLFLDSIDVNIDKIVKKEGGFIICEPSEQFIFIKKNVDAEYECIPFGPFKITYADGSTRIFPPQEKENPDKLKGSIRK